MEPNKSQKGDSALLYLAARLSAVGFVILEPICGATVFDLGIYVNDRLYRLQVKRAQKLKDTGRFVIPFRSIRPRQGKADVHVYTKEEVDYVVGVVIETNDLYVFPMSEVRRIAGVTVDPLKTNGTRRTARADLNPEDYRNRIVIDSITVSL